LANILGAATKTQAEQTHQISTNFCVAHDFLILSVQLSGCRRRLQVLPGMVTFSHGQSSAWELRLSDMKGDHSPRHVHVYRGPKLVVKWDPEHSLPMKGKASRRLIDLIAELEKEGAL